MTIKDNGQDKKVFCPWMREECVEGKCPSMEGMQCRLWSQVLTLDVRFGVPKPTSMCVFQAQLLVQGSPKPEMQTQKIPMSNFKIT